MSELQDICKLIEEKYLQEKNIKDEKVLFYSIGNAPKTVKA